MSMLQKSAHYKEKFLQFLVAGLLVLLVGLLFLSSVQTKAAGGSIPDLTPDFERPTPRPIEGPTKILFQNTSGPIARWNLDFQGNIIGVGTFTDRSGNNLNPGSWKIVATGNINRNTGTDFVFQAPNGDVGIWFMINHFLVRPVFVGSASTWKVKALGNFCGDGRPDIVFQNVDGQVGIWTLNWDGSINQAFGLPNPGTNWEITAAAKTNAGPNNYDSIMWSSKTGINGLWTLNSNCQIADYKAINNGQDWKISQGLDVNGDGVDELAVENKITGQTGIWFKGNGEYNQVLYHDNTNQNRTIKGFDYLNYPNGLFLISQHNETGIVNFLVLNSQGQIDRVIEPYNVPHSEWQVVHNSIR